MYETADFGAVKHLLPDSVQALITVIGFNETLELVRLMGGTTYPLRQGYTKNSQSRVAYLEEIIGSEAAGRLVEAMAPCNLFIPRCETALYELRNRKIRSQFDRQTAGGTPAYEAVNDLALAHRLKWGLKPVSGGLFYVCQFRKKHRPKRPPCVANFKAGG